MDNTIIKPNETFTLERIGGSIEITGPAEITPHGDIVFDSGHVMTSANVDKLVRLSQKRSHRVSNEQELPC